MFLALEVVTIHVYGHIHNWKQWAWIPIAAVPSFLAISGFMVLGSLQRSGGARLFWTKRALRILPAFCGCLAVIYLLHGLTGLDLALRSYYTFGSQMKNSPNGPLWSLSVEEVAYALMTVLAALGFYRSSRRVLAVGLFGAAVTFLAFLMLPDDREWRWRILMLVAPFFLGSAYFLNPKPFAKIGPWALPLAVLGQTGWWYGISIPIWERTFPIHLLNAASNLFGVVFGAIAVLHIGTMKWQIKPLPVDISYGVYVYHSPLLVWLFHGGMRGWAFVAAGYSAAIVVSLASYLILERPALRLKERLAARAKSIPRPDP